MKEEISKTASMASEDGSDTFLDRFFRFVCCLSTDTEPESSCEPNSSEAIIITNDPASTRSQRLSNGKVSELDSSIDQDNPQYYRDMAINFCNIRKDYHEKAHACRQAGDSVLANFYFNEAKKYSDRRESADQIAAQFILRENNQNNFNNNTIDLHGLYVKEAVSEVDLFIDGKIQKMQEENYVGLKQLTVITGQGIHSKGGIPKIKPAIIQRLAKRRLTYELLDNNPGVLEVTISQYSLTSTEFDTSQI